MIYMYNLTKHYQEDYNFEFMNKLKYILENKNYICCQEWQIESFSTTLFNYAISNTFTFSTTIESPNTDMLLEYFQS